MKIITVTSILIVIIKGGEKMKCTVCKNSVPEYGGKLLTPDGDFACGTICETKWHKEKDAFFKDIVHNENKVRNWLLRDYPYYP
jgi:hypothetical protein